MPVPADRSAAVSNDLDLVTRVREHAERTPDAVAVRFHRGAGVDPPVVSLTYAQLDLAARTVAVGLRELHPDGDARVLLTHAPGLSFVTGFLGCLYAGVTPVPTPPPTGHRHQVVRSAGIARDCGAALVLTDPDSRAAVAGWLGEAELGGLVCAATEDIVGDPLRWRQPPADPARLAFLQYTSGSTSEPKGVMVSHGNLTHNIELMRRSHGWHAEHVFCSWLPTYHDMGLIAMLLTPLYLGATTVLLSAMDFLKRPHLWLDLIHQYRANISCAPNFAYDLATKQATDEQIARLDLSAWSHACNGAEPVNAATLARFAARFAPAGLRPEALLPGYGLAEATLYVSGTRVDTPPVVRRVDSAELAQDRLVPVGPAEGADADAGPRTTLVSSGVVRDLDVRVVDADTGKVLADREIGEVWIRGDSVARGYWRRPDETAQTFGAVTAEGDGPFMRTGDLGAFDGEELFITGRRKEMLIINGRNLYPHDIEREATGVHPVFAALPNCVFSVPARGGEAVVLVQEVRARGMSTEELHGYARTAKTTLGGRLGVRVPNVVFVRPGRVLRTTSGKIQRRMMRELFMTGALEPLYEDLDADTRAAHRSVEAARPAPAPGAAASSPASSTA
jgi:acyl-CoA synthetase (AMP-forming)/AMP-acid ligase II